MRSAFQANRQALQGACNAQRALSRMHGGTSTGPRTPEGLERSRKANWKHGGYSAEAIADRRKATEALRLLRRLVAGFDHERGR